MNQVFQRLTPTIPQNISKYPSKDIEVEAILAGIDYTPATQLETELSRVPDSVNLLVMHQTPKQFFGIPGAYNMDLNYLPMKIRKIPVLLFGDVHKPNVLTAPEEEGKVGGGQLWVMGGSPYVCRLDEVGYKHCVTVVCWRPGHGWYIHQEPIPHRIFQIVDMESEKDRDRFDEFVKASYQEVCGMKPVYIVQYAEDLPNAKEVLERVIKTRGGFLFARPQILTKLEKEALPLDPFEGFSMTACLEQHVAREYGAVAEEQRKELATFAADLLLAQDPCVVVDDYEKEFLNGATKSIS